MLHAVASAALMETCSECSSDEDSTCIGSDSELSRLSSFCSERKNSRLSSLCSERKNSELFAGETCRAGVTITHCGSDDLAKVRKLWLERGGQQDVCEAWRIDNPRQSSLYRHRKAELEDQRGCAPAEMQCFYGSPPATILDIAQNGFNAGMRSGLSFRASESFAKEPSVALRHCEKGSYMLICLLCLGSESRGDHVWVPKCSCYVMGSGAQVLLQYIVRFKPPNAGPLAMARTQTILGQDDLTAVLALPLRSPENAVDQKMIDLAFDMGSASKTEIIEARPAAWQGFDVKAFQGRLFFDADNCFGDVPPCRFQAQGKVVIFHRGGQTTFAQKEANARSAGAAVMLVVQKPRSTRRTVCMTAANASCADEPTLPAAMVSEEDGKRLLELASMQTRVKLVGARCRSAC